MLQVSSKRNFSTYVAYCVAYYVEPRNDLKQSSVPSVGKNKIKFLLIETRRKHNRFRMFFSCTLMTSIRWSINHHISHHNKHGSMHERTKQSRKNSFLFSVHHIRVKLGLDSVFMCRIHTKCVLASINSPSLSRVSLAFRVTIFFFFLARILQPSKKVFYLLKFCVVQL